MPTVADALAALLLEHAWRSALVLLLTSAAVALAPERYARYRAGVAAVGLALTIALPLLSVALPAVRLEPSRLPGLQVASIQEVALKSAVASGRVASRATELASVSGSLLLSLWLIGSSVVAFRLAAGWRRARGLVARAQQLPATASLRRWLATPEATSRLRRRVAVAWSEEVDTPFVWGHLRPVVVVPGSLVAAGDGVVRAVMLHELEHLHHADWLARIVSSLACLLGWFNPMSWWLARRVVVEQERACDAAVTSAGVDRYEYASCLVQVAAWQLRDSRGLMPALTGADVLEDRIMRILKRSTSEGSRVVRALVMTALAVAAGASAAVSVVSAAPAGVPSSGAQSGVTDDRAALREVEEILRQDAAAAADAGDYEPAGRRDPFVVGNVAVGEAAERCAAAGPESLRAAEVRLDGIIVVKDIARLASLTGFNGTNVVVRAGAHLCDAVVVAIGDRFVQLEGLADSAPTRLEIGAE